MNSEVWLAVYLMAVGLSLAGMGTHLYQGFLRQQAMLRFDGGSIFAMFGNLIMSFVCGPYIMLRMGLEHEKGGAISLSGVLLGSAIAFGWAFITGLLFVASYLAVLGY